MEELVKRIEMISERIEKEKNEILDNIIFSMAENILFEENNVSAKKEHVDTTYKNKTALVALYCLRIAVSQELIEMGNVQYNEALRDDIESLLDNVKWIEGNYSSDIVISDTIELLATICGLEEDSLTNYMKCEFGLNKRKKEFTDEVYNLFDSVAEYLYYEEYADITKTILEKLVCLSRERNFTKQHEEVVLSILARWTEALPEFACDICYSEDKYFKGKNDFRSDFLWFYGIALEKLEEGIKAREIFEKCYDLRKKIYGDSNWFTAIAKRECNYLTWYIEKKKEAFDFLIEMIDDIESGKFSEIDQETIDLEESKLLYLIINHATNTGDIVNYDYYLKIYERLCHEYNDSLEPIMKERIAYNYRGSYYLRAGDYMLAEEAFINAINSDFNEEVEELISIAQIKSNLLMVYYGENDLERSYPLLMELLEMVYDDEEDNGLTKRDEYRIYTLLVSFEMQAEVELSKKEIDDLKELVHDTCKDVCDGLIEVECASEEAVFLLSAIFSLIHNDYIPESEQKLCLEALYYIEKESEIYNLYSNQQALLYFLLIILNWNLNEPNTEYYMEKGIMVAKNPCVPVVTRVGMFQAIASYYGQNDKYDFGKKYLDAALQQLTALWQSYVRYLNDMRLLQILSPSQSQFLGCYAVLREYENIESAYERVLQYKELASLVGKERNRILHMGYFSEELLSEIQGLQNRIALLESENIFRETSKEYIDEENKLRRLEVQFSKLFPKKIEFTEITYEKVKKAIPDNVAVIEYISCINENIKDEESATSLDIYVVRKENGVCKLNKATIPNAVRILELAQCFVEILQAKADNYASVDQLYALEEIRGTLYQSLIKPILPYVEDMDIIYIGPDNNLINLPFGILCDEDGELFETNHSIIEIECARDFLYNNAPCSAEQGTLIIGNPEYEVREIETPEIEDIDYERSAGIKGGCVGQLPFSELEIRQVGKRSCSAYFSGKNASKDKFLSAKGYKNIHIATHGSFDLFDETASIYSSSLMFAGVNNWLQSGMISSVYGNGLVTADEVSRMDLRSTELVVLSSCLNGMNEVFDNKGFHGMVGALSAAGVHYVISHFWVANDFSTAILMDSFYYHYVEKKQSPPIALKNAKQYLRNITIGDIRKQGWFESIEKMNLNAKDSIIINAYRECNDKIKPFKNEEYWGGFVCYRCN